MFVRDTQGSVDHESEKGVHWADIVQHVTVVQNNAAKENQEIQPPHHLPERDRKNISF